MRIPNISIESESSKPLQSLTTLADAGSHMLKCAASIYAVAQSLTPRTKSIQDVVDAHSAFLTKLSTSEISQLTASTSKLSSRVEYVLNMNAKLQARINNITSRVHLLLANTTSFASKTSKLEMESLHAQSEDESIRIIQSLQQCIAKIKETNVSMDENQHKDSDSAHTNASLDNVKQLSAKNNDSFTTIGINLGHELENQVKNASILLKNIAEEQVNMNKDSILLRHLFVEIGENKDKHTRTKAII
jgi:hypothetical protein